MTSQDTLLVPFLYALSENWQAYGTVLVKKLPCGHALHNQCETCLRKALLAYPVTSEHILLMRILRSIEKH